MLLPERSIPMKKSMRMMLLIFIALVTLGCAGVSADAAAYYPTLTYNGDNYRYVKRGHVLPFKITLRANKFYSVSRKYRACMRIDFFDYNTGRKVGYMNPYNFTAVQTYKKNIGFTSRIFNKSGWYVMRMRLRIRNNIYKSFRTYKDRNVFIYVY